MEDLKATSIEEATEFLETPIGVGIGEAIFANERLAQELLIVLVRSGVITNSDVQKALDAILIRDMAKLWENNAE